jgi:PAS domain S-box-containing protein
VRDVIETQVEQAIAASERRFRALIENQTDGFVLYDAEGRIKYLSPSSVRMFGFTEEDARGTSIFDFVYPEDRPQVFARWLAWSSDPHAPPLHIEYRLRHRDGSYRWLDGITTNMLENPDVRAFLVNFRDVTDKRKLEEQLRQSQKMEAIGLLAGGVAHDFNNMLSIILGATELAQRAAPPGSAVVGYLDEISSASLRAVELTRKLLMLSRRQVLRVESLELRKVVTEFGRLLSRVLGEDIELKVTLPPDPVCVRADAGQLNQILLNLGTNARQAMPKGGRLTLEVRETVVDAAFVADHPWAHPGSFGEIRVEDSGQGMSEETLAHIFEPFFTTKEEGTGLGLPMVYGIVRQHGGCLAIESQVGVGTTVRLLLPLAHDVPEGRPASRSAEAPRRGHETVLVAEDEGPLRSLLASTLAAHGYEVLVAGDGEEALRLFEARGGRVDLAILDAVMPRLSGADTYARMRAIHPGLRAVFITGHAPDHVRIAELVAANGYPVLDKPFRLNDFVARVRDVLDQ